MFAQINYSEKLGNGPYAIAQVGCLDTAFCNLLERFGEAIDPATLNNFFISHNAYKDDPADGAGVKDDLNWSSVSIYNSQIITSSINGGGWPVSSNSIVEFRYKSQRTGQITNHFCLVNDSSNQTIVDSYDGTIKVSPYGTPIASASYEHHTVQVVTPPAPVETPAFTVEHIPAQTMDLKINTHLWDLNQRSWPGLVNNPVGSASKGTQFTTSAIAHHIVGGSYYLLDPNGTQGYNVVDCETYIAPAPAYEPVTEPTPVAPKGIAAFQPLSVNSGIYQDINHNIPGYRSATDAGNHTNSNTNVPAGIYPVYNVYPGKDYLINVRSADGKVWAWINLHDDVDVPEPVAPVAPTLEEKRAAIAATWNMTTPVTETSAPAVPAVDPDAWQKTYQPFLVPTEYIATRNLIVQDLSGQAPELQLARYISADKPDGLVKIYGTFRKDGVDYYRAKTGNDKGFKYWYGIPKTDPHTGSANLLVKPLPVQAPISTIALAKDAYTLAKTRFESDASQFIDIIPKWFKKK